MDEYGIHSSGLLTDLYEIAMAAAYHQAQISDTATFELYVRSLPPQRNYLVAAGLEQAVQYLEAVRFSDDEISWLREQPVFDRIDDSFFDDLTDFRFTGDVWAIPEGTPVFSNEPLLRITAPIVEAQLVETYLLTTITFQTMVASKASRVKAAAGERSVIDFGSRRAHGPEAALLAARASSIGGCDGTSNVAAGRLFDIPVFGTMAHSFVMAFESEEEAFDRFIEAYPETATLLVDTYDTIDAVSMIVDRFKGNVGAIRLDSGDLGALASECRKILDDAEMTETRIIASGDLDEYRIRDLLTSGAPIDSFGVGTKMVTSSDAPSLGGVYKLVSKVSESGRHGRVKLSAQKKLYPHSKQVWRMRDDDGRYAGDEIRATAEPRPGPNAEPLLEAVIRQGKRIHEPRSVDVLRERTIELVSKLPASVSDPFSDATYPVCFSEYLESERDRIELGVRSSFASEA